MVFPIAADGEDVDIVFLYIVNLLPEVVLYYDLVGKAGGFDCLNAFQHIVYNIQLAAFTVEIVVGDTYDKIVAKFLCATQKVDVPLM